MKKKKIKNKIEKLAVEYLPEATALFASTSIQLFEATEAIDPRISIATQFFVASLVYAPKILETLFPSRTKDLTTFLSSNKDSFLKEIVETEEFRSIYLEFLTQYFKENSEEKRKLLQNYLLSMFIISVI